MDNENTFSIEVTDEIAGLEGDPRRGRRASTIMSALQRKPGLGFPEVFEDASELEAAYRFFGNSYLSFQQLLTPHREKTLERVKQCKKEVLCIQDTSTFVFSGDRQGLGFINKNNRGFLGHFALAVGLDNDGPPVPLGVLACRTWTRDQARSDKGISQHKLRSSEDCESRRWLETTLEVEQQPHGSATYIFVEDREGDIYDNTSTMVDHDILFVLRSMVNRVLNSADPQARLLFDALDGLPVKYRDIVQVSNRPESSLPDQKKAHPAREGRQANVCVTATTVTVKRTRNSSSDYPAETPLNIVHVFEPEPPNGEDPVVWVLMTNLPISTSEEIRRVVNIYRQRWIIEEFFKAIKTGCSFLKRQLGSYHSLTNALAMTIPIAWCMLLLRCQSRTDVSLPARMFISDLRLRILAAHAQRYKLPDSPTLKDVAYAIAGMGGWLKRNGPPGWLTLKRGFERLLTLEEGWVMSMSYTE